EVGFVDVRVGALLQDAQEELGIGNGADGEDRRGPTAAREADDVQDDITVARHDNDDKSGRGECGPPREALEGDNLRALGARGLKQGTSGWADGVRGVRAEEEGAQRSTGGMAIHNETLRDRLTFLVNPTKGLA